MHQHPNPFYPSVPPVATPKRKSHKYAKKKVRIIKKVRAEKGVWKFISLDKVDGRYVWDNPSS